MYSLLLVTAMGAVGDMPNAVPASRAYFPARTVSQQAYSMPRYGVQGGCCNTGCNTGCCPTDNVDLFFPCAPAPPCPVNWFPCAPSPVCAPRVFTYPCPTPCRVCPPGGRYPAPCP